MPVLEACSVIGVPRTVLSEWHTNLSRGLVAVHHRRNARAMGAPCGERASWSNERKKTNPYLISAPPATGRDGR